MTDYVAVCEGATSAPVYAGSVAADCATAGGAVVYVPESAWGLPDLTLEGGAQLAVAIISLLVIGFFFRAFRRVLET